MGGANPLQSLSQACIPPQRGGATGLGQGTEYSLRASRSQTRYWLDYWLLARLLAETYGQDYWLRLLVILG